MTDIVERLRKRQMMQDVRGVGDRFNKQIAVPDALCQLAADEIERLRAELATLRAASASVQADQRAAIDQARELLRIVTAERDALRELLCECRTALMWPGGPAQAFLDRIDAATASRTTGTEPGAEGA